MATARIPPRFEALLEKRAVAHVATIGPRGEPQSSPVWFGWDGEMLAFSHTKARQKYRNLIADPHVAVSIADPDSPETYLEIRGTVTIEDDPQRHYIDEMSLRYTGRPFPPRVGEERVIVRVRPTHVTFQG
ncbi:MAG TPA: PPOX class F420-dependent oxidoreductase [Actinomycetota bacterium]|nr:PPOX class F420-dependent oxidoreductase [Actinomycetota bacterium]